MEPHDPTSQPTDPGAPGDADQPSQRPQPPRQSSTYRTTDDGRRKKGSLAQRYAGWGDPVDRQWCAAATHEPPQGFPPPAQRAATVVPIAVARRPGAVLICDGLHAGPCHWADFDPVSETERRDRTNVAVSRQPRPTPPSFENPDGAIVEQPDGL